VFGMIESQRAKTLHSMVPSPRLAGLVSTGPKEEPEPTLPPPDPDPVIPAPPPLPAPDEPSPDVSPQIDPDRPQFAFELDGDKAMESQVKGADPGTSRAASLTD
jgi:hypothetical protein